MRGGHVQDVIQVVCGWMGGVKGGVYLFANAASAAHHPSTLTPH